MSKRLRFLIILGLFVLGGLSLYPSFEWYFLLTKDQKAQTVGTRQEIRNLSIEKAQADTDAFVEILSGVSPDVSRNSKDRSEGLQVLYDEAQIRAKEKKEIITEDTVDAIGKLFKGQNDVYYTLLDYYGRKIIDLKKQKEKIINLGLDLSGGISAVLQVDLKDLEERLEHSPSDAEIADAIDRAMFVLQNRIDKFGVSEPRIRKQGNDSIRIEIPGDNDRERVNSFLQGKGSMSFRIVHEEATQELVDLQGSNPSWTYNSEDIPNFIPAGTEVMEYVVRDNFGVDQHQRWIVVYQDVDTYGIDGVHLQQAEVTSDSLTNRPLVNFQLDSEGAQKLSKLTNDYLNQSMAIVLDSKIRAYATLSVVINDGQAVIRGFDQDLAQDISTILKTASLPVVLEVVNQQVIGPTLGQAVIDAGFNAILIGVGLIIVFMFLFYKGAGLISIISLLCNMFLLTAVLSAFNFTITLTGIAGIILTMGMAVDANVLIFERIKEELSQGKTRRTAIQNGFRRAFWTIVDANLTTFIAAFFISQIASGPIQGFAVTLSAGIITTLISALFISRWLFDIGTDVFKSTRISISWRKL